MSDAAAPVVATPGRPNPGSETGYPAAPCARS